MTWLVLIPAALALIACSVWALNNDDFWEKR